MLDQAQLLAVGSSLSEAVQGANARRRAQVVDLARGRCQFGDERDCHDQIAACDVLGRP